MIIFARNLVVKDFWLKLFSLALAILIWLTVRFSISGETTTSPWLALIGRAPDESVVIVPVHVPPGATQNFTAVPEEVKVTLRGDANMLKNLQPQDIHAQVDMTGIEAASGLLRPVEIILPKGIFYTTIEPEQVEVQFTRKTE